MVYLYTALTALLLSSAQTFWKKAATTYPKLIEQNSQLGAAFKVFFSPNFILGAFLYVIATLVYIWLFSKYPFYIVQISMISFGIIFSIIISQVIFKEQLGIVNILGIILIITGVFLVVGKK